MIGSLAPGPDPRAPRPRRCRMRSPASTVVGRSRSSVHFDADGLSAAAILVRALERVRTGPIPVVVGKGRDAMGSRPWRRGSPRTARRADPRGSRDAAGAGAAGLPDARDRPPRADRRAAGRGHDQRQRALARADDGPAGLVGGREPGPRTTAVARRDRPHRRHGGGAGFAELTEAQQRWGKTALRDAVSLINAPRRTAAADAGPALRLLLQADGPKEITKGQERRRPGAARGEGGGARRHGGGEARAAAGRRRCRPDPARFGVPDPSPDRAAMARAASRQDRHRGQSGIPARLGAFRGPLRHRPQPHRLPGRAPAANADGRYGNGHAQATGGALRAADWNSFVTGLGIPQAQVSA